MFPLLALFLVAVAAEDPVNLGDLPMQNPDLFEGDIIGVDDLNDRNAIENPYLRWPGGKVPYVIDSSLAHVRTLIEKAFQDYHTKTCIRFIERTTERHYIKMFSGEGCYSNVGRVGFEQPVSLGEGCHFVGTIVHELCHAIGFYHEQNRSDRDDHLIIYWDNIQSGMASQFQKLLPSQNTLYNPFDIESIMLYGEYAFSKDGKSKTMVAKSGARMRETYDKPGLCPADVERVKLLYDC